jgi:molybdenum cofactor cytidylyltransferase
MLKMNKHICGLLIASGYSGRMTRLKALLDLGGVSFITGIVLKLSLVCEKVIVVLGHEKAVLEKQMVDELTKMAGSESAALMAVSKNAADKLEIIYNEGYDDGMFTSLQKGISKALPCPWLLYHFVDQPAVPKSFYYELAEQTKENCGWIQPFYEMQSGHPLLLSSSIYKTIVNADPGDNLRNILMPLKKTRYIWRCGYPEILDDVDTIEDYNKVKLRGYNLIEDLLK